MSRFVLYREVSFIQRLKCTGIIGIGTSRFVLYREVFFIWSVLYTPVFLIGETWNFPDTNSAAFHLPVTHPHTNIHIIITETDKKDFSLIQSQN